MTQEEIEKVAERLYALTDSRILWNDLDDEGRKPYVNLADSLVDKRPEILAELVSKYCVDFGMPSKYKAVVAGIISGILTAVLALTGFSVTGCSSVEVTEGEAVLCKDGSCLVLTPGHISYSQAQPETDVPPVVQVKPNKK
jgi:hypothetical protein